MPYLALIYGVIIVAVLVDIVVADGHHTRGVPKMVWVLLSLALPLIGPIAWLALGRPPSGEPPEPVDDTPDVAVRRPATDPDREAAEFDKAVRARAEAQRRTAREQRDADG